MRRRFLGGGQPALFFGGWEWTFFRKCAVDCSGCLDRKNVTAFERKGCGEWWRILGALKDGATNLFFKFNFDFFDFRNSRYIMAIA